MRPHAPIQLPEWISLLIQLLDLVGDFGLRLPANVPAANVPASTLAVDGSLPRLTQRSQPSPAAWRWIDDRPFAPLLTGAPSLCVTDLGWVGDAPEVPPDHRPCSLDDGDVQCEICEVWRLPGACGPSTGLSANAFQGCERRSASEPADTSRLHRHLSGNSCEPFASRCQPSSVRVKTHSRSGRQWLPRACFTAVGMTGPRPL
jgi:hypothetical protein